MERHRWEFEVQTAKGEWRHLFTSNETTRERAIRDAWANIGGFMKIRAWRIRGENG